MDTNDKFVLCVLSIVCASVAFVVCFLYWQSCHANDAAINAGADFAGISNGSMCQNMQDICGRFRAVLFEKFVRWPTTPEERQRIRRGFADATDCPGDASPFR